MVIPELNGNGVLPPYNGDPNNQASVSPYPATTLELCERFGRTPERRAILRGYLKFRDAFRQLQMLDGHQWVSGDFLEDDRQRQKPPDHIQVVTLCFLSPLFDDPQYADISAAIKSRKKTLSQFRVDHMPVLLSCKPKIFAQHITYWTARLSHQNETGIWKGFLQIDLNTTSDDIAALNHLESLEETV